MPSIIITVFILQLVIHLANTLGASTINSLLWNMYNRLPTPTSKTTAEHRRLQREFFKLRKELNMTSSQDEFAKWAKLRRQHDKMLEQLEKTKASLDTSKAKFDSFVSTLRWICTNGLRLFLQFWYSKQPMFWLPQGWIPYYAEWLLSFPHAPLGSISIQAWQLACTSVVLLVSDAIVAVIALVMGASRPPAQEKEKLMKHASEKPTAESASTRESGGKEI